MSKPEIVPHLEKAGGYIYLYAKASYLGGVTHSAMLAITPQKLHSFSGIGYEFADAFRNFTRNDLPVQTVGQSKVKWREE